MAWPLAIPFLALRKPLIAERMLERGGGYVESRGENLGTLDFELKKGLTL